MSDTTFDLGTFNQVPVTAIETFGGAPVEGNPPVLSSSDETVATVTDNGDGTGVVVRVTQDAGSVTITARVVNPSGAIVTGTLSLSLAAIPVPIPEVDDVQIVPGTPS